MESLLPMVALCVLAMISGGAWLYLQHKGEEISPQAKMALGLIAIPLVALLLLLQVSALGGKKGSKPMPGDNDIDTDPTPPTRESESERIGRLVESDALEKGSHFRDVASDDEVAGRGAALFDPGPDNGNDSNRES